MGEKDIKMNRENKNQQLHVERTTKHLTKLTEETHTFNTYSSTRGHPYKLYVNHSRINVSKHFFACRVVG